MRSTNRSLQNFQIKFARSNFLPIDFSPPAEISEFGATDFSRRAPPPSVPRSLTFDPRTRDSRGFYRAVYIRQMRVFHPGDLCWRIMWQNSTVLVSRRHASRDTAALIYWVARGRCWPHSLGTANDTAERALGDPPNAGDSVRRKITFLGRRTRKRFFSRSLRPFPRLPLRLPLATTRRTRLAFGRHESFETFGPLPRKPRDIACRNE